MTTKEVQNQRDLLVRKTVVLDGGNRFINWIDPSGNAKLIPSYVKELEDWEDASFDDYSVLIELGDRRFVVGQLAFELGGEPVFLGSKANLTWLLVAAILEPNPGQNVVSVDELRILCTDKRDKAFQAVANSIQNLEWLGGDRAYRRNGQSVMVGTIHKVSLIDEGVPAFRYASQNKWWKYPARPNAILDIGGGDTTGRIFTPTGVIDRQLDLIAPGTKELARLISAALLPHFQYSPSEQSIMDAIARGDYLLQTEGFGEFCFEKQFANAHAKWMNSIRQSIKQKWSGAWNTLGEVLVVGGSAPLLNSWEIEFQGRVRVAKHDMIPNFSQLINVHGLAL